LEDKSIELQLVEQLIKLIKFSFVLICVMFVSACIAFVSVNWKIVNFMNQYEFEETKVEIKADGNSDAIYQNGKGNTINERKHNGDNKNNEEKENN
jgi:hypothetical protein